MIKRFIKSFDDCREEIIAELSDRSKYWDYLELIKLVVSKIDGLDVDRIKEIDDGDYQGTKLFIIGEPGYQPSVYYMTRVSYGSCSSCDSLEGAMEYEGKERVNALFRLCLTMLQELKCITKNDDEDEL